MNAPGKEDGGMKAMSLPVTIEICEKKPDYTKTAGMLLTDCRAFYENPENEKAFREWKESKKKAV